MAKLYKNAQASNQEQKTENRQRWWLRACKFTKPKGNQIYTTWRDVTQNFGRFPQAVVADRSFGGKVKEEELRRQGVQEVAIPWRGKRTKAREEYEKQCWFRRLCWWRAGCEASTSRLKRKYGLRRNRMRGHSSARIWVGWGIMAHNLVRIGA